MFGLIALLVSSLVSACGSTASAHAKVLRMAVVGELAGSDPALASTEQERFLASLLFSGLVKLGPDLHVIPELAVSIPTISEDGRNYTFTIRHDARFEDGRHCTAWDVAYSLTRALRPETGSRTAHQYLVNIQGASAVEAGRQHSLSGIRIIDRLTLRIRLRRPDAEFLDKLTQPAAYVVEAERIARYRRGMWGGSSAGTGPWTVAKRDAHGALDLLPRHHFYGGSLQVGSLVLVPAKTSDQAATLYRRDLVDLAEAPVEQYRVLSQRSDFHESPSLDGYYVEALGIGRVDLASSLDRDKLVMGLSSSVVPLDSIVPGSMPDYLSSPPTLGSAASGSSNNMPLVRFAPTAAGDWITHALQRRLALQWPTSPRATHLVRLVHIVSPLPDPAIWLRRAMAGTSSRWFTSVVSHAAQRTNDPVGRMSAYSRAENWAISQGYVIPLVSGTRAYLMRNTVDGLEVTPLGLMPSNNTWSSVSVA